MYELDATAMGGSLYRFTQHDNYGAAVVWNGQSYNPYPIIASGFDMKANGALPRPTIAIANVNGFISAICRTTSDLIGAKVTRIRTFLKYLDAVNFPGGVNPNANPAVELPREIWRIDRRSAETRDQVAFEMAAPWDVNGVKLPRRIVVQNACAWGYRSSECGYTGGAVATASDVGTSDPLLDACGKRISSCKLRFGTNAELPFGGFPSVGQTSQNS
jgi:lambda family phage minor tail protein L